jgi:hypothetical protein
MYCGKDRTYSRCGAGKVSRADGFPNRTDLHHFTVEKVECFHDQHTYSR